MIALPASIQLEFLDQGEVVLFEASWLQHSSPLMEISVVVIHFNGQEHI